MMTLDNVRNPLTPTVAIWLQL